MNFPTTKVKQLLLTHYGHDEELQLTHATKRKCLNIAAKLKQGVSCENIQQPYDLKDEQRHPNDQESVFYKLQGKEAEEGFDLRKDDFSIAIQSPTQTGSDGQQEEIEHILTNSHSHPDNTTTLKTRVNWTILQIMEEVDQCTSSSALKQLKKQTTAAASLLASLKNDKEQEVIPLKVNENSQANKNMETRHDSTRPKRVVVKPKYDLHVQRMKNSRPS